MSAGAIVAIVVGGCLLVFGGIAWMMVWLRRSYREGETAALGRLRTELANRGWTYAERDDSYVALYNGQNQYKRPNPVNPLIRNPQAHSARDVVVGTHRGRPFVAATYEVSYRGEQEPLRCIWVRTPAVRSALTVTKVLPGENVMNAAIGRASLALGNPEFDKRFRVSAEDDRFAAAVLNPRMIQQLLAAPGSFRGFWLLGDQIDMLDPVSDHRDPAELIPALDRRCDLLDLIPTTAWA
ncbi:MAG TPA: DUF3137 domain-containing protein [Amycolatopsis sp.]|jgi:hypothetical protein|nr:DUF3137 domain-containing protein [Amycolatopsis sp.]